MRESRIAPTVTSVDIHSDPIRTKAYALRRTNQGKSPREIKRCLKRAVARQVYRVMETHAASPRKKIPTAA